MKADTHPDSHDGAPASPPPSPPRHGVTDGIVRTFLNSNLALILMILAVVLGIAALVITPREEDPQIVVPLADVFVQFPGHTATEVEQLVSTPLEKILYQIDGVEYVYSMSKPDQAIITVRFYVGEDRERSLVKLFKTINEHIDLVPPGVVGWVIKPVEIDDVPVVTLTLTGQSPQPSAISSQPETARTGLMDSVPRRADDSPDEYTLRRVAEECVERLAAVKNVSRAYVVGGRPRVVNVYLDPDRLQAHNTSPLEVERALGAANLNVTAGEFSREDRALRVEAGRAFARPEELLELVVGVSGDRPVFLRDVARIEDGPAEPESYVRHGWGPARGFTRKEGFPGTVVGAAESGIQNAEFRMQNSETRPAVTIALAKKKGTNAVWVAEDVLKAARELQRDVIPDNMQLVITRNYGLTADEKVNDLVEGLAVAIFIVIALLTVGLGWREALIVAVAVPVVFGLTLTVNLLFGYTINRVTLFALILSLGLLVDDPIVDVENIARHFGLRKKATRQIVREAVAEIRPPLITATLAVIVSFLPMFFITGMMGPYMRPMALNVPVAMLMSMVVAFTITPWLSYHVLKRHYCGGEVGKWGGGKGTARDVDLIGCGANAPGIAQTGRVVADNLPPTSPLPHLPTDVEATHGPAVVSRGVLYRIFAPLLLPLLRSRLAGVSFLAGIAVLTVAAMGLAATRAVPLKMLPFDNKNELLLVLDFDEGTTLERTDAAVRDFERYLAGVPEVADFTSYVGLASPMDFNGLVRHYYLRRGPNVAEVRIDLAGKKNRRQQSHALGLRWRDELTALAREHGAKLKVVELPPGPPVIASVVAEVYGRPDHRYEDLLAAMTTVRARLEREPGVVDVDDIGEAAEPKLTFAIDKEKAALAGVSVQEIANTLRLALSGDTAGTLQAAGERNPLRIELRLPRPARSSQNDLALLRVKGQGGQLVPLAELGHWEESRVDQTIYHKNLQRVAYVFAETAGRPPADCVVDIEADRLGRNVGKWGGGKVSSTRGSALTGDDGIPTASAPRPIESRTFARNGGGVPWNVPDGIRVDFAGEGEWNITLDVFRDLGLAFGAALVGIYILLVAQTRSFSIPVVVMLAIPLTVLGVLPGFWLLNKVAGGSVGGFADPVFFTATAMIGMIALAGIVTRNSIILIDFIHLSLRRGRPLAQAIVESTVIRLRPILLTAAAAMLGAAPIVFDPIFSGLAWALIFGLLASTLFTLFVIPLSYNLLYANRPGQGVVEFSEE